MLVVAVLGAIVQYKLFYVPSEDKNAEEHNKKIREEGLIPKA